MGSRLEKNSKEVKKRVENHAFHDEDGSEYEASAFGGFADYFHRKKIKLQNLDAEIRSHSSDNSPIFRGVVVHVNGYTQPSLGDLHKLIVSHHGGFMQYLDGKTAVTHIIASNLTQRKAQAFQKYRIVKPAWIFESVIAGKLLPWSDYKTVDEGSHQNLLMPSHENGTNGNQKAKASYREQSSASWYTENLPDIKVPKSPVLSMRNDLEPSVTLEKINGKNHIPQHKHTPLSIKPPDSKKTNSVGVVVDKRTENVPNLKNIKVKISAEEHNKALLSDPNIRKNTVVDPAFLDKYYQESRLHHLSAWKANLKAQMQCLINQKTASQKAGQNRICSRRYVFHVDFDCFFAAVAIRKKPKFQDKPVVIAHGGTGSEIASCNYAARKFGVKNGMWMKRALELCPKLTVFPYDFPAYEEISRQFYGQLMDTGAVIQSVSVDEALMDVTDLVLASAESGETERERANAIALELRQSIKILTDCDVSIGIGENILLARLACRKAKPAGQFQVQDDEKLEFLAPFSVRDLPGVASHIGMKLEEIGVTTIETARNVSKEKLLVTLGPKTGEKIWNYSRGIDKKEVGDVEVRKSISAEINWGVRFENQSQVEEFIYSLCGELRKRLLKENVKGKQLTIKILKRAADAPLDPSKHLGHGLCETLSKSVALGITTIQQDFLTNETLRLLNSFCISPGELRGLGVQMTQLEPLKVPHEIDGSQKLLQFKPLEKRDYLESDCANVQDSHSERPIVKDGEHDLLERNVFVTPKKTQPFPQNTTFAPQELNELTPRKKPLNTMGSQFILPTQADPQVLAELPSYIRSRLLSSREANSTFIKSRSDGLSQILTGIPNRSQMDQDVFNALPTDVQHDMTVIYDGDVGAKEEELGIQLLKAEILLQQKKSTEAKSGPRKRGRPPKISTSNQSNVITSHFFYITAPELCSDAISKQALEPSDGESLPTEINPEYLAALPDDLCEEALGARRHEKPHEKTDVAAIHPEAEDSISCPTTQRIQLSWPTNPTFTAAKLENLAQLRPALTKWVQVFEKEGPYEEDIVALVKYLEKVVMDESNIDKAVNCYKWLDWSITDVLGKHSNKEAWRLAMKKIKFAIQGQARKRNLGRLKI